ncbi:uncharacterized protein [Watersipora subatra]|uniref:uncharacterized protein n=1 Tax=Watersipora subatra TaxID=2589382 RepID=UPI00355B8F95
MDKKAGVLNLSFLILVCYTVCSRCQGIDEEEQVYLAESGSVCVGEEYEVGCGIADGSMVMNVTKLCFMFDSEEQALTCNKGGLCFLTLTPGEDNNIPEAVLDLMQNILDDCQGKAMCRGTIPTHGKIQADFEEGSYDFLCGWNSPEYLVFVQIVTRCIDVGHISSRPATYTEFAEEETSPETVTTAVREPEQPAAVANITSTPTTTQATPTRNTSEMSTQPTTLELYRNATNRRPTGETSSGISETTRSTIIIDTIKPEMRANDRTMPISRWCVLHWRTRLCKRYMRWSARGHW